MAVLCTDMGKTKAQVARTCKVDPRTVGRWVAKHRAMGAVDDAPRSGRPPVLEPTGLKTAVKLMKSNHYGSASEVAKVLHGKGLTPHVLSRNAVVRATKKECKKLGLPKLVYKTAKPKKKLSERNKLARVEFCKANLHRDWKCVMITDRKRFPFKYPGEKVRPGTWGLSGEDVECTSVNHPKVYNIYAGCTKFGMTAGRAVSGTYGLKNSFTNKKGQPARGIGNSEYSDVMKMSLLPQGADIFNNIGIQRWVFQQDNDSSHSKATEVLSDYNKEHGTDIQFLKGWPPNSPDLSPIENIWALVDKKVTARGCVTMTEFCKAVEEELKGVRKTTLEHLWKSMQGRMEICIQLKGGKVPY